MVFCWILYKSKQQRDKVNAKVVRPIRAFPATKWKMPFDSKRMIYGGFEEVPAALTIEPMPLTGRHATSQTICDGATLPRLPL